VLDRVVIDMFRTPKNVNNVHDIFTLTDLAAQPPHRHAKVEPSLGASQILCWPEIGKWVVSKEPQCKK